MISLSIVLPTYNRLARLKQVIAALEKQTVPPALFEVIVVSDGSTDNTNDFLIAYSGPLDLKPLLKENGGVATARNAGFRAAVGDLILFIDDDVIPTPNLLEKHLAQHQKHDTAVVVVGPMLTPPDFDMAPWVLWEQAMLEKQYQAMADGLWEPTARQFYTGNTSLARRILVDADGFDASFRRAEDVELAYRLSDQGFRFVFDPEAIGYHYADRSFASWIDIPYAYGRNDVIFCRDKKQLWLLPTLYREFQERHSLIRLLVKNAVDRPLFQQAVVAILKQMGRVSHGVKSMKTARLAYSAIFNVRYFQGVADEIGGGDLFFTYPAVADLPQPENALPAAQQMEKSR